MLSGDCLIAELERFIEKEKPKENLLPDLDIVFTIPNITTIQALRRLFLIEEAIFFKIGHL